MNEKELSQKVLEKIKEEKIQPKAKWEFLLKESLVWVLGTISLIVGGLAFSVVIHMSLTNDWDVYEYISESFLGFLFGTLPYFWLLFLALFVFIADYNFRHTKTGYRHKLYVIVTGSIITSMLLGGIFYVVGMGRTIDRALSENAPQYYHIMNHRRALWGHPERGLLSGVVVELVDEDNFKLKDMKNSVWMIDGDDAVMIGGMELIKEGERLRVIGKRFDDNNFKAIRIMPWIPRTGPVMKINSEIMLKWVAPQPR